jgi:hypothetical protein
VTCESNGSPIMSVSNQHFLVVGSCQTCSPKACDCRADDVDPDFDMSIECPGVTDSCMAYVECFRDHGDWDLDEMIEKADSDGGVEMHGEWHKYVMGGGLCVETKNCWVQVADSADAIDYAFHKAKRTIEPGRYPIDFGCPDFGEIEIFLLDQPKVSG